MNKVILMSMAVLFFSNISGAMAEECKYESHIEGGCRTWKNEGSCGTNCTYTYANGTLNVKATGDNATIEEGIFSKKYYKNEDLTVNINNVIIDGNFSSIEKHAFLNLGAEISSKNGQLILPANSWNSFGPNTLKGEITVSDAVNSLSSGSFHYATINGVLIIPDNIKTISSNSFLGFRLTDGSKIYCAVDDCANKIINSCAKDDTYDQCVANATSIVSDSLKFEQAPEGCSYWSADGCKKCSNENFKFDDGYCYRIRYTPAEAAEVAGESNTIFLYYR